MNILQFLRIIWARRMVILGAMTVLFVVALAVVQIVPPRYRATTQVMLNIVKPDPVTGQVIATAFLRAYTKTQTELVKGQQVAQSVVKELAWAQDPQILKEYNERDSSDRRDFDRWATQKVIDGTEARLIDASNILEISYSSNDPTKAKQVADALSRAYMMTTLQERRETARRNADWYDAQAEKAKTELLQAEKVRSNFERSNGILLQDNNTDLDSARLAALAAAASAPVFNAPVVTSQSAMQLAQLESEISEASKNLGPNHPRLQEMQRRRTLLAAEVAKERGSRGAGGASSAQAAGLFESQKNRVLGQRELVEQLRLLQTDVELKRNQYTRAATRAAELRQEAQVADTGVTPLGSATTPPSPEFPNKPLILGGALAAGGALGFVAALALELLGRRIRGPEDLRVAVDAPILGIISHSAGFRRQSVAQRIRTRLALLNRKTRIA